MTVSQTPSSVRLAHPSDEDALMELLHEWSEENGYAPMADDKVRETLRRMIDREGGVVGVVRGPSGIEASIGLTLSDIWFSNHRLLTDHWCFVRERYRTSQHAKALLQFARRYGVEVEIPLHMTVVSSENGMMARWARSVGWLHLYQRQLGNPIGALFVVGGTTPPNKVASPLRKIRLRQRKAH